MVFFDPEELQLAPLLVFVKRPLQYGDGVEVGRQRVGFKTARSPS